MTRLLPVSDSHLRRIGLATVVANIAIVVTGGAVRLTGSGLGCSTWPKCTDGSYVPTDELSYHTVIEFGNRTLTFVLGLIMAAALVAAWTRRPRDKALVWLAVGMLAGIPAQAVIGGITVRTQLNPWTVGAHFLVSMILVGLAVLFWHRTSDDTASPVVRVVRPELRLWGWALVAVTAIVVVAGVVVTGSGPHAGDEAAARTGLDPEAVTQFHSDAVMLLIGLSVAGWLALRATGAPPATCRAAAVLIGVELAQGVIGFVQYFTGLPTGVVAAHLLGACLVWVAALRVLLTTRAREVLPAVEGEASAARVVVPLGSVADR